MVRPRLKAAVIAICAAALLLLLGSSDPVAQPPLRKLHVHFIDVGQADATLIMDDARECVILIDAADTRYPQSAIRFREYLLDKLPAGSRIDLAIASHPHSDHIGSMVWVFMTYRVKTYVDNGQLQPSALYTNLQSMVDERRQQGMAYVAYRDSSRLPEAPCGATGPRVRALFPRGFDPDICEANQNDCSVVTKVTLGGTSFLFPGDAEQEQEDLLLADPDVREQLNADVLKVAHHGSDTSSGEDFLGAVSPSWMVISAGEKDVGTNKGYKHPRRSTVRRLLLFAGDHHGARMIDVFDAERRAWRQARIWGRLFVTARDGTVILSTDGIAVGKE